MHELSMVSSVVETALAEAKKRNASSILQVNLVVGEFTMLGLEQLRYCYRLLTKDTILQHSTLRIEKQEGRVRCEKCKFEGSIQFKEEPEYHLFFPTLECPRCGGPADLTAGRDCYIKSVKLKIDRISN
jgi:hydrogenase nickel incorporation protein HypA/HybF